MIFQNTKISKNASSEVRLFEIQEKNTGNIAKHNQIKALRLTLIRAICQERNTNATEQFFTPERRPSRKEVNDWYSERQLIITRNSMRSAVSSFRLLSCTTAAVQHKFQKFSYIWIYYIVMLPWTSNLACVTLHLSHLF